MTKEEHILGLEEAITASGLFGGSSICFENEVIDWATDELRDALPSCKYRVWVMINGRRSVSFNEDLFTSLEWAHGEEIAQDAYNMIIEQMGKTRKRR